eukprot:jgi/Mesvir1/18158/Mv26541-RA.1
MTTFPGISDMRVLQISVEEAGNQILRTQRQLHEVQEDMSHLKKAVVARQEATDVKVDAVFKELVELKSLVAESVKTGQTSSSLLHSLSTMVDGYQRNVHQLEKTFELKFRDLQENLALLQNVVGYLQSVAPTPTGTGATPTQLVQPAPEPSLPEDVHVHPVSDQVPAQEPSCGSPHSLDSYVPCSLSGMPDRGGPSRKIPIEEETGSESEDGTECPGLVSESDEDELGEEDGEGDDEDDEEDETDCEVEVDGLLTAKCNVDHLHPAVWLHQHGALKQWPLESLDMEANEGEDLYAELPPALETALQQLVVDSAAPVSGGIQKPMTLWNLLVGLVEANREFDVTLVLRNSAECWPLSAGSSLVPLPYAPFPPARDAREISTPYRMLIPLQTVESHHLMGWLKFYWAYQDLMARHTDGWRGDPLRKAVVTLAYPAVLKKYEPMLGAPAQTCLAVSINRSWPFLYSMIKEHPEVFGVQGRDNQPGVWYQV